MRSFCVFFDRFIIHADGARHDQRHSPDRRLFGVFIFRCRGLSERQHYVDPAAGAYAVGYWVDGGGLRHEHAGVAGKHKN